jgi:hypothetical protein
MKTLNRLPIEDQLSKEIKKHEAVLNAEYITMFDAGMYGNDARTSHSNLNENENGSLPYVPVVKRKLVETMNLPAAYHESSNEDANKAKFLNGFVSPCYSEIFKAQLDKGEMSLAVVHGQVKNVVYAGSHASGFMWKNVVLKKAYPFDVEIKAITEIRLPANKNTICTLEPGNLNLTSIAVRGSIFNFINHRYDIAHINSAGHWTPFLKSARSHGTVLDYHYEKEITDTVSIILPAGRKEFKVGSIGSVTAVSSFDPENPSPWPQNYGYGLVDLRSHSDPYAIILDPTTHEYKTPPGGIQLFVKLEIYKVTE